MSLCDYRDAYIDIHGNVTVPNTGAASAAANNASKKGVFKNCAVLTNSISNINNMSIDNAKEIDVVMPIYNLIEYMNIYSKTSESLWQHYRDEPALDNVTIL